MCVIFVSSHLHILFLQLYIVKSAARLHLFASKHVHLFTSSHLHTSHPHNFTYSSHHHLHNFFTFFRTLYIHIFFLNHYHTCFSFYVSHFCFMLYDLHTYISHYISLRSRAIRRLVCIFTLIFLISQYVIPSNCSPQKNHQTPTRSTQSGRSKRRPRHYQWNTPSLPPIYSKSNSRISKMHETKAAY